MRKNRYPRHPKGALTSLGALGAHLRVPWVTAWWSAALPGCGHLFVSNHIKGFILICCENKQADTVEKILEEHQALGLARHYIEAPSAN